MFGLLNYVTTLNRGTFSPLLQILVHATIIAARSDYFCRRDLVFLIFHHGVSDSFQSLCLTVISRDT